jgi:hypothetical protein
VTSLSVWVGCCCCEEEKTRAAGGSRYYIFNFRLAHFQQPAARSKSAMGANQLTD